MKIGCVSCVRIKVPFSSGQNILDNFTKLSNIGFSRECFTADFSQFSRTAQQFPLG